MECPRCASTDVRRSRNSDWPLLRLILCVRARCHWCGLLFIAPMWRAMKPEAANSDSQPERRAA
ncbi:hypothetical protein Mal4_32460 [Maioricimonas rarisocia]|uniref:Uncharacterized protein n=1 Tax=Maioricimonas rarisocia TaxID=2528026 RepID=A0A517Z8V7_9PLAN|nr:hypothetical protein Mal4_32460 [Maioricimonas rarisocia]